MVLLFIGPSGSGKDTQAEFLTREKGFVKVSSGDLIRDISEGGHEIQKIIRQAMNEGFLADDFIFGLLHIYLSHLKADNLVLSGVVRRHSQIELLDFTLFKLGKELDKVIYFELDDEVAVKRMSSRVVCPVDNSNYNLIYNPPKEDMVCDLCGSQLVRREDDNEESIKKRLADFHKDNDEIIEEYEKRGILIKVDAGKSIDEIRNDVETKLNLA